MFALATADVALSYCFLIRDVPAVLTGKVNIDDVVQHVHPKNLLYVTNKCVLFYFLSSTSHTALSA